MATPSILRRIWDSLCNNEDRRWGHPEHAYSILDYLENDELLAAMESEPGLAPFILWQYGVRYRWPNGADILNDSTQMLLWHQVRARHLVRHHRHDAVKVDCWHARNEGDLHAAKPLQQELRRHRVEELTDRHIRLSQQRDRIQQLQAYQAAIHAGTQPTAAMQANLDFAADIPSYMESLMAETQREITLERDAIRNNQPPIPPLLPDIPTQPIPIPTETVTQNVLHEYYPIEGMIAKDYHMALRVLARVGLFNPLGYTHLGYTYLHHAVVNNSPKVVGFLLSYYTPQTLLQETAIPEVLAFPLKNNHLKLFALRKWARAFNETWPLAVAHSPTLNAGQIFNQEERENLCTLVTQATATSLAAQGLDLSAVTAQIQMPNPNTWWPTGGSSWHLATMNHSLDFLDFLMQWTPHTLNDVHPVHGSVLEVAVDRRDDYPLVKRLIELGADYTLQARTALRSLVRPDDRFFQLYFTTIGAGLSGTEWVHDVVEGLQRGIVAREETKRTLMTRAKALIRALRQGNGAKQASFVVRDALGQTPEDVARRYQLYSIVYLLQPRSRALNGRGNGSRFSLRAQARKQYTA